MDIVFKLVLWQGMEDICFQLNFSFTVDERSFSMEHFVDNYPKSPYICLLAINVLKEPFRRHVEGGPNVEILEKLST
jgi:hypothetical protein